MTVKQVSKDQQNICETNKESKNDRRKHQTTQKYHYTKLSKDKNKTRK